MKIKYRSEEAFYDGIHAIVKKGLTFNADHDTLTITLTGGF